MATMDEQVRSDTLDRPEGAISAAIISAGIGAFTLGLLTTLAEASESIGSFLEFNSRVGALSGKTILAVVVWLIAWAGLHAKMKDEPRESKQALTIALVLVAAGVLLTFPTFFQLFAPAE